ncbi:glycosyltransferase [Diaphorobacter sp. JS3051]|uniref:MraY family glycosyltransferase n=1 Tax=Diaphorobacter sp. JS3051 TaxID=2792224 RepID=UPI0018C8EE55|nr:glycosyltransferase [Diaphorobacter sp. JS3051]QPN33205.1 glycosyltransferase family 4 protein [Diaphorobacter sp. JS3051]
MPLSDPLLLERLLLIVGASFAACLVVVLTQNWHGKHSLDHDLDGAQKLHTKAVPRVGGLGLMVGLLIAGLMGYLVNGNTYATLFTLLVCALPVFLAGFVEDLTKNVSVRTRLLSSFVSAALAVWLLQAQLPDVDTPGLDALLQFPIVAALFTIFAVGGVTHSVNIIDGLNGLAGGAVCIMLAGLASLAWMHGDSVVMKLCLSGMAAMLGFMLLNYPFGKIFLGDGGAYLAGFWLAECAVLLLVRNPEVSTWTVLLCCLYPVLETAYSMFRRHVIHKMPSGLPDMGHLHQLLYKWLHVTLPYDALPHWISHGVTSVKIWVIVALCQLVVILAPHNTALHLVATVVTIVLYVTLHRALWAVDEPSDASLAAR